VDPRGLPPVRYYLRYGLDPYCEPTGERATYEGVEFIEIGPVEPPCAVRVRPAEPAELVRAEEAVTEAEAGLGEGRRDGASLSAY